MTTTFLFTVASLTLLGLVLALVLYFIAQKFRVEEDPRIDEVEAILPGANCGGCGFAGCRALLRAVLRPRSLMPSLPGGWKRCNETSSVTFRQRDGREGSSSCCYKVCRFL